MKFTIPGDPVAKPRMTQRDKWMKRPCVMRYRAWKDKAAMVCAGRPGDPSWIKIEAYLRIPNSWSKKKKYAYSDNAHRQKPDVDNILKAVIDALWKRDERIWFVHIAKYWDDGKGPRIEIEVS